MEENIYIYFDEKKQAHVQKIPVFICKIEKDKWQEFQYLTLYKDYDIVDGKFIDLRETPEYIAEKIEILRSEKHAENTAKAKQAVGNGYVVFKNAQFETNAQTVGDLTATMLILQASGSKEPYTWLSKDDKAVELSIEDFGTLGSLIAEFKNTIWSEKYIAFKNLIEQAETLAELEEIEIEY